MKESWEETVERGVHVFHRDFGGVTLTITRLDVPDAWACILPDGKRVVGELQIVKETVEMLRKADHRGKSSVGQ